MKKFFILMLTVIVCCLVLVGCGKTTTDKETQDTTTGQTQAENTVKDSADGEQKQNAENSTADQTQEFVAAYDFDLADQFGNQHKLDDYKDKIVFLNFWQTWCGPCRSEIPDLNELYNELGKNEGDVAIIGVSNPANDQNQRASEVGLDELKKFIGDNDMQYPVLFDLTGDLYLQYKVMAFPTTVVLKNGKIVGAIPGALPKDKFVELVDRVKSTEVK